MEYLNNLLKFLHVYIKKLIFIIGKTIVKFILNCKSYYFEAINFFFNLDYTNAIQYDLVLYGWSLISLIIKIFLILILVLFYYLYFKLSFFIIKKVFKIWIEVGIIPNCFIVRLKKIMLLIRGRVEEFFDKFR